MKIPTRRARRARRGLPRFAIAGALLVGFFALGCGGDDEPAGPPPPQSGFVSVNLTKPAAASDAGAMLAISGVGIDSLRTTGSYRLFSTRTGTGTRAIVAGALQPGRILEFWVPNVAGDYQVDLLQVAADADGSYEQRELGGYSLDVSN